LLPDKPTVGFRIWFPPGIPLEADRTSIVATLDHATLLPEPSEPARHEHYFSQQQTVDLTIQGGLRHGSERAQVRYEFSREPGHESCVSGRLLDVDQFDLLERVVAVVQNQGGFFAMVAADLTIEKRLGSLFAATSAHGRLIDEPFGISTHGLPGLGWRTIFGPASVDAIGVDNFVSLGARATQRGDCAENDTQATAATIEPHADGTFTITTWTTACDPADHFSLVEPGDPG